MLIYLFWSICFFTIVATFEDRKEPSNCYNFSDRRIIEIDISWPISITVSLNLNIYIIDNPNTRRNRLTRIQKNKDNKTESRVIDVLGASVITMAVDKTQNSNRVYLGCNSGLKIYEELTGRVIDIPGANKKIVYLFLPAYGEHIFAILYPNYYAYKFTYIDEVGENTHVSVLRESGKRFVLDLEHNLFYINMQRNKKYTYYQERRTEQEATKGMQYILELKSLSVNRQGTVFGIHNSSIYRLLKNRVTPQLVTTLDGVPLVMCFDGFNNIVIGGDGIYLWKYDSENIQCNSKGLSAQQARKCYFREKIDNTLKAAQEIVASYKTGNLYIATIDALDEIYIIKNDTRKVITLILLSREQALTRTIAVDHVAGKLFIGTEHGIEIYDEISGEQEKVERFQEEIYQIFVQSVTSEVFIRTQKESVIYKFKSLSGSKTQVESHKLNISMPLISFVTDEENIIYGQHFRSTLVWVSDHYEYRKYPDLKFVANADEVAYATADDTLFVMDNNHTPQLIAELGFHFNSMCFDGENNLYFATPKSIVIFNIIEENEGC